MKKSSSPHKFYHPKLSNTWLSLFWIALLILGTPSGSTASSLTDAISASEGRTDFVSPKPHWTDAIFDAANRDEDGVLKVLAIGNSFSEDAIENYLHELAAEAGIEMVVGNLYIGGASLELHWDNAQKNAAAYDYRKINIDGKKSSTGNTSIATAIEDEEWDFISLQQVSGHSGQFETFQETLPQLVAYVKKLNKGSTSTQYILHQTWAYSTASTHPNFPNYKGDQSLMYTSIVDAVGKAKVLAGLDHIVPSGTAIQNGRAILGEEFTRDGYHLSLKLGRYTAACTWFEYLTGKEVVGMNFAPEGLSKVEVQVAQEAAHAAVENPREVTK